MKKYPSIFAAAILYLGLIPASAQLDFAGGQTTGVSGNGIEKLFGSNQTFSATMEMQINNAGNPMTMSGKMSFDKGNSRFETDMSEMKGGNIPPDAAGMMKSAGLDRMVTISQSDKKIAYIIYPNAQCYAETTPSDADANDTNDNSKVEITELGKETVDGHPCVKNKAVVTDKQGIQHEFTVWDATDLKNFPIKVEMNEQGQPITTSYSNISFSKPDASLFALPTGYTKYNSMQEMMQSVMLKKMGGFGAPPSQP